MGGHRFARGLSLLFGKLHGDAHRQRDTIGEQMVGSHGQRDSDGRVTDNAIRQVHRCVFFYSELYTISFRRQLSPLAAKRAFDAPRRQSRCNSADFRHAQQRAAWYELAAPRGALNSIARMSRKVHPRHYCITKRSWFEQFALTNILVTRWHQNKEIEMHSAYCGNKKIDHNRNMATFRLNKFEFTDHERKFMPCVRTRRQ